MNYHISTIMINCISLVDRLVTAGEDVVNYCSLIVLSSRDSIIITILKHMCVGASNGTATSGKRGSFLLHNKCEPNLCGFFVVLSFCQVLTVPAFFLGANASEESIKVANIACSTLQIKMATLREAL